MSTSVQLDPGRLAVIHECMEAYDIGEAGAEWPNNIISRRTVVYDDGTIARETDSVRHALDRPELDLCRRLSDDVARAMAGVSVGMGSESDDPFRGFFLVAPPGSARSEAIDETLVRSRFGGTLFPPVTITVEPLTEDTTWWSEVALDGAESGPDYFVPWRAMSAWFRRQQAFMATAFVRIGDSRELSSLPGSSWPEGTVLPGSVLPRIALGLTANGSLAGLFGYVVQS